MEECTPRRCLAVCWRVVVRMPLFLFQCSARYPPLFMPSACFAQRPPQQLPSTVCHTLLDERIHGRCHAARRCASLPPLPASIAPLPPCSRSHDPPSQTLTQVGTPGIVRVRGGAPGLLRRLASGKLRAPSGKHDDAHVPPSGAYSTAPHGDASPSGRLVGGVEPGGEVDVVALRQLAEEAASARAEALRSRVTELESEVMVLREQAPSESTIARATWGGEVPRNYGCSGTATVHLCLRARGGGCAASKPSARDAAAPSTAGAPVLPSLTQDLDSTDGQSEVLRELSALDDRLVEALQRGDIRLLRATWLRARPASFRLLRRQQLEALEVAGEAPTPLLRSEEAVALVRRGDRSAGV